MNKTKDRHSRTSDPALVRSKYQIFPSLPPAEREALKASITHHGVENATTCDDQGNVIDGWERETICHEIGITCTKEVRQFASEADKFKFILAVNAHRRPNLSQKQKREVIEAYLRGDPEVADNMLGETLGVSKNTVLKVRRRLEASGEIPKVDKTKGKDGKCRPVKYAKKIITNSPNEFKKAQDIIKDLPDTCAGKTLDITTAKRRAARNRNKEYRDNSRIVVPLPDDAIRLYHCRFQELEVRAEISPGTAPLVLTDIPYDQTFLPQIAELGQLAKRVLVKGGLFVCMCGQYWLHKVKLALSQSLTYRWENAFLWDGEGVPVHIGGWKCPHGRIVSKWKPILVYSNGAFTRKGQWCDVYKVDVKEKHWHPWQQPLELFELLVRDFSDPGDVVVDPCGGGFTTAEACLRLSRRFVGCDNDANSVSKGQERLELARANMTLGA